ncbi:MAG: S-layer homology domain-containing protein [Oscillospiraceae bacterium]|nr:S-layer homology domain-containing protein [Oscillospiraceae bacterium]
MEGKKYRVLNIMLCACLLIGLFSGIQTPKAAVDDDRYQVIYDKFEELHRTPPMAPSKVYEEYGDMNGDYYVIAMEENLMRLSGNSDVRAVDLIVINDNLKKNGSLPEALRKSLREDIKEYGLDCTMPNDPDFIDGTAETPKPTGSLNNSGGTTGGDSAVIDMMEKEHEYLENNPQGTPAPTEPEKPVNTTFDDVDPDAWYADAVAAMVEAGLLKGKDDGLFHPDDIITVAEWCTLIHRITYKDPWLTEGKYIQVSTHYDHWAASQIARANMHGLTEMYLATDVYPEGGKVWDAIAQRGEAITAVVRIREKMELGLYADSSNHPGVVMGDGDWTWDKIPDGEIILNGVEPRRITTMGDGSQVKVFQSTHYWNAQDILNAYNLGIIDGVDSAGTCNPTGTMTRAQACQMIYNAGLARNVGLYGGSSSGGIM